ncbi:MAG: FISUMP domain-containing protein [Bacteroidales bacterium]
MKKIIYLIILISLLLCNVQAQKNDLPAAATVLANEPVVINLNDYQGSIQWQQSEDAIIWENIEGETSGSLSFMAVGTMYYRAEVIAGICDPFYSDTTRVIVNPPAEDPGNGLTDIQGNFYPTLVWDNQEWMTQNLRTVFYNDGIPIPGGVDNDTWQTTSNGAFSVYPHENITGLNNDDEVTDAYGLLYNAYAVASENLCPTGWKVADNVEWAALVNGVTTYYDHLNTTNIGNALKSCRQVNSPLGGDCDTNEHPRWDANAAHHGEDLVGFAGLPGGTRAASGDYYWAGNTGGWWSSYTPDDENAGSYALVNGNGSISSGASPKSQGLSVRCMRNLSLDGTFTLSLQTSPSDVGIVTGGGEYQYNEVVPITAAPTGNWSFKHWERNGVVVSAQPEFNYTMIAGSHTLTAVFGFVLEVIVEPQGQGAGNVTLAGVNNVQPGNTFTLTATPSDGFAFSEWHHDGELMDDRLTYSFDMPENDVTITAYFSPGVQDVDGNSYPIVTIGEQQWFAKNLMTTKYNNGDPIPRVIPFSEWNELYTGAYDIYPYNYLEGLWVTGVVYAYGRLYNHYAVTDDRGVCPTGWKVPDAEDFLQLKDYLIAEFDGIYYSNVGNKLKSCRQVNSPLGGFCSTILHPRWSYHNSYFETDEFGFKSLPAGGKSLENYSGAGDFSYYWTTTINESDNAIFYYMRYYDGALSYGNTDKNAGLSIRCVKE